MKWDRPEEERRRFRRLELLALLVPARSHDEVVNNRFLVLAMGDAMSSWCLQSDCYRSALVRRRQE